LEFVHANTRSLDEYIYEDHPKDDVRSMLESAGANVIVMGHTHLPYVRSVEDGDASLGRLVVNAGSMTTCRYGPKPLSLLGTMPLASDDGVDDAGQPSPDIAYRLVLRGHLCAF